MIISVPLYLIYQSIYLKHTYSKHLDNIHAYVAEQVKELLVLPNQMPIQKLALYRIQRDSEKGLSRTGIDLKPK